MKKNLNKIQNSLNKILRNKLATDLIYGLPVFHISKGHQANIKPHNNFLNNPNNNHDIKNLFTKIKIFLFTFFSENKIFYSRNIKDDKYDIFLISNIISDNRVKEDYIFGNLADDLNKNNIKTLSIFKNFSNKVSKKINTNLKRPHVVLSKTTSIFREITFLYNIFLASKSINLLKNKIKDKNVKKFLTYVNKLKYLTPIVNNIRLYYQITVLIRKYRPNIIIFTFENHGWERFLIKKIKSYNNKIKTVGYQFTTISKNQYSKYSRKEFNPDLILSSGSEPFKFLVKVFKRKIKVLNFGSYRKKSKVLGNSNFYNKNFLLVPEAPLTEVDDFLNAAVSLAVKYSYCKFTLRLHPMSKSKDIIKRINYSTKNLKNFVFSDNSLNKDLNDNFFIIHRASSLSIMGALRGLLPIYLSDDNFNLDPLFEINKKYTLNSCDDLKKILLYSRNEKLCYQKKASKFCDRYFEKPNYKNNLKLFNNLNKTIV